MNKAKWLIFALLFGLIGAHIYHIIVPKSEVIEIEKIDTIVVNDTISHTDTITITKPILKYTEIVKIDTLYKENGDTIQLVTENKQYKDTICAQNDTAIVTSFIQGINATLDSTKVDWRRQEIIKTIEITNTIYKKPKHWNIGASLGYGLGLKNRDLEPFIGITLQYKF